jgi:hypothetical protein
LSEYLLEFRLRDAYERGVLTCAKACVATAGVAGQQRLLTDMVERLEFCQDDFVTIPINGENMYRALDDNVGAIAGFTFPEDESRGGESHDSRDFGKFA